MKRTKVLVTPKTVMVTKPKVVGVMKRPKKVVGARRKSLTGNNYASKYTQD